MPARILPPQIPPESVAAFSVSRPAQSPPEVALANLAPGVIAASVALPMSDEEIVDAMREVIDDADNLSAWQEVVPRRLARSIRLSSQASPAMSGRKTKSILHVNSPLSYPAVTSSISPVLSEASDSSEFPTVLPVESILPVISSSLLRLPVTSVSQPVVSKSSTTPTQSFTTETSSIAERINSPMGRMTSAQRAYVANATRLARMLSPDQLSARSERVYSEIENFFDRGYDTSEFSVPVTLPVEVPYIRTSPMVKKIKKNKRAHLTIAVPTLPALAEISAPASVTLSSLPTSVEIPGMIAPENVTSGSVHFNPYCDRVMPEIKYPYSRAMVLDVTQQLLTRQTPFAPSDCVVASKRPRFLTLLQKRHWNNDDERDKCVNRMTWSVKVFCENLLLAVPDLSTTQSIRLGFVETMSRVRVNFDLQDPSLEEETDLLIQKILSAHQPNKISDAQMKQAVNDLKKKLPEYPTNWRAILLRKIDGEIPEVTTVARFRFVWYKQLEKCREHIALVNHMGGHFVFDASSRQYSSQLPSSLLLKPDKSGPSI